MTDKQPIMTNVFFRAVIEPRSAIAGAVVRGTVSFHCGGHRGQGILGPTQCRAPLRPIEGPCGEQAAHAMWFAVLTTPPLIITTWTTIAPN